MPMPEIKDFLTLLREEESSQKRTDLLEKLVKKRGEYL